MSSHVFQHILAMVEGGLSTNPTTHTAQHCGHTRRCVCAADRPRLQVEDPLLAQHLAHWGINMMGMQKTEKSMAELQIDLNVAFEFDKITEAGAALRPLSGAGYVDHRR